MVINDEMARRTAAIGKRKSARLMCASFSSKLKIFACGTAQRGIRQEEPSRVSQAGFMWRGGGVT